MKGKPGLAIVLGGKGPAEDEGEDDIDVSPEEMDAASAVRSAKSDEDYAKALKAFVKICGDY